MEFNLLDESGSRTTEEIWPIKFWRWSIAATLWIGRWWVSCMFCFFNTLRRRQNGPFCRRPFKLIFLNGNVWITIKISLKFVPKGPINNILSLVQIIAWRRSGDKPLSEPMTVSLSTHICVTRPQWVFVSKCNFNLWYCSYNCNIVGWKWSNAMNI